MSGIALMVDTTPEVLSARRMRALHDLAQASADASSLEVCLDAVTKALAPSELDLPFLLCYALDADARRARLVSQAGLAPEAAPAPDRIDLTVNAPWPVSDALATGYPVVVDDVQERSPGVLSRAYPEPIQRAYVLPIQCSVAHTVAVVIAGVSPRLPLDESYRMFFELLTDAISGSVARAFVRQNELQRATIQAEVDQAKMAFFSNVSHEFRTPLTLILSPIEDELAEEDEPLAPGRHARLETAHRNALRLLRMVNTLLDFSHIEAGHLQSTFEPVDLAAVTEELANSFRAPIEKAGLRLSTRLEPLPEPVYVDREMWTKIVLNLLSNALKHTFKGGITVSLFASDESKDHVELRVDDTGIGIPQRELPQIFQRFHRVKGARSRSNEGTGIGLALIRALATLHGGDVGVVSREGLGSSFRVRLPRGAAHLPQDRVIDAPRTPPARDDAHIVGYVEEALQWSSESYGASEGKNLDLPEAEEPRAMPGPRPRVLLADNNTDMRNYVARLLSRSYDVRAVTDGEAALAAARTDVPDLIVLDVMLPPSDGLELLKDLRAAERTCLIPVVLLSARAGEDAALEGLEAGADDYLVKPFSGKALLARVRSSLALAKLRKDSADKLTEANKELEAFSYSVSHDLRAPLRAIDGFSKALLNEYATKLDDNGRRYLDRVRTASQRMAELIDDLLSLSRITRAPMKRERVDLTALSRKILGDLAARDADRQVEAKVEEGLAAQGDTRLVAVVLENLLGNAWKFTSKKQHAHVEVGSQQRDGQTVFFIRDNGAGFDMEYATKLFTPFQRLHSTADFQGTGIGLATVHRVITRHGGKAWAEAAPGLGAAFFFTLGGSA